MLLIDLQQAFDKVWHTGLIYKTIEAGVPEYIIYTITSYLKDRKFYVTVDDAFSSTHNIAAGVPQGSILGPVLFNIFINDCPQDDNTELGLFADDGAIYAHSFKGERAFEKVEAHGDKVSEFFERWLLQPNGPKCESILFTRTPKRHGTNKQITFSGSVIERKKIVRYLGAHFDSKLNWSAHIAKAKQTASGRFATLYPILSPKNCIQEKVALTIFKACIWPILTYASPVWSGACKTNINNLQVVQNKVLRTIAKVKWTDFVSTETLHERLNVKTLRSHINKLNLDFYNKAENHDNVLIKNFATYAYSNYDLVPRPRDASLQILLT
jgi:Reverse transcriptase (RNA-dependent DNA polymerase)